jgi:hypothetical protein
MQHNMTELIEIVEKFAVSGWDLIENPSRLWLKKIRKNENLESLNSELIEAIRLADAECGSCGCQFDPLYKKALLLLQKE